MGISRKSLASGGARRYSSFEAQTSQKLAKLSHKTRDFRWRSLSFGGPETSFLVHPSSARSNRACLQI